MHHELLNRTHCYLVKGGNNSERTSLTTISQFQKPWRLPPAFYALALCSCRTVSILCSGRVKFVLAIAEA